jgi:hypothetical protein
MKQTSRQCWTHRPRMRQRTRLPVSQVADLYTVHWAETTFNLVLPSA